MAFEHIPHLKKNTAGTSNELSFDVLDAARNELDGKKGKSSKISFGIKLPKASQGSSEGIGATSTLTAQDEVNKRKEKRRKSVWRRRLIVAVLLVALAVGVGMFAHGIYSERQDFAGRFNDLVSEFVETDKTLVEVDKLMLAPLDEQAADERKRVAESLEGVIQRLRVVDEKAQELAQITRDEQAGSAVARIREAANARIGMAETASSAFEISREAVVQTALAKDIWEEVLDADQLARRAVDQANEAYDYATTQQAQDLVEQAKDAFEDARSRLAQLESACPGLSLSAQLAYVDKRIEALGYALSTGEALMAGDRQTATVNNDAYNRADQEAARMAASLPLSLTEPVGQSFKMRMDELLSTYSHARETVSESDAVIRDYLGEHR